MSFIVVVVVAVHFLLSRDVSATSCYNYQIPSGQNPKDSSTGSTQKDCTPNLRAQQISSPGVCIKSSFKDRSGLDVITGACYPKCPTIMNGQQCIYPDGGGQLSRAIAEITQISDASYFCCCETDYCNSAGKVEVKWVTLLSLATVLFLALLHNN